MSNYVMFLASHSKQAGYNFDHEALRGVLDGRGTHIIDIRLRKLFSWGRILGKQRVVFCPTPT